jgi:hypothetical protein
MYKFPKIYLKLLFFCVFLQIFCLKNAALAVYDISVIETIPSDGKISFCFDLDVRRISPDKMYLAFISEKNGNLVFIEQAKSGLIFKEMSSNTEMAPFIQWKIDSKPTCVGPFENGALQSFDLYAGVGPSFENVIQTQNYSRFFDGFPVLPHSKRSWTIMLYMVGSDLEQKGKWASKDFLEMLEGSSQSPPNISNLIITTGGSSRNGWQTVKRTFIENGQQYVLEDLGPKSMADPQTLSDFVIWAKAKFPAEHYALILWNHGSATGGYALDTSNAGKRVDDEGNFKGYKLMSLPELHQAYQNIRHQMDKPLDIVIYDACLMASIEVAEITATVANAMAGSAELEPGHGIDYAHLLSNVGTSPPDKGLTFGRLVKTGYIQHTKDQKTFEKSPITYSVFDLAQLASFSGTFKNFALELKEVLKELAYQDYERLSRGLIRAPGYPAKQLGSLRALNNDNIHIDLYSLLQTVGPDFMTLKTYADQLLVIIDQMVVDYEGNIGDIDPKAGRVSLDIGNEQSYLAVLPEAYTLLSKGLEFYNRQKQADSFMPDGKLVCPKGFICAFAQWLELAAEDILGIEAYFGQAENSTVYLIDPDFYQYQELSEDLELGVNGHEACQYQLCVNETACEDITLTQQGNQLLADISLNDSPSVLSFCNHEDKWLACGVVQQTDGIWGRDDGLYSQDSLIPSTLHVQGNQTERRQGKTLKVHDPAQVRLKKTCDQEKGAIWAMYYSLNQRSQIELLCDTGDCVCQPDDTDQGCKESGFKAGVYLIQ